MNEWICTYKLLQEGQDHSGQKRPQGLCVTAMTQAESSLRTARAQNSGWQAITVQMWYPWAHHCSHLHSSSWHLYAKAGSFGPTSNAPGCYLLPDSTFLCPGEEQVASSHSGCWYCSCSPKQFLVLRNRNGESLSLVSLAMAFTITIGQGVHGINYLMPVPFTFGHLKNRTVKTHR